MKKIVSIVLGMMICLLSVGMMGCNGGFKDVLSVEYTVNGSTTTYTSQITIESDNIETAKNIPDNDFVRSFNTSTKNTFEEVNIIGTKYFSYEVDKTKSNTKKYKKGRTFFVRDSRGACYTGTVKKVIVQYVGVKIKNDKKIEIRKLDGEVIQVLADNYVVKKFS